MWCGGKTLTCGNVVIGLVASHKRISNCIYNLNFFFYFWLHFDLLQQERNSQIVDLQGRIEGIKETSEMWWPEEWRRSWFPFPCSGGLEKQSLITIQPSRSQGQSKSVATRQISKSWNKLIFHPVNLFSWTKGLEKNMDVPLKGCVSDLYSQLRSQRRACLQKNCEWDYWHMELT